MTERAKNKVTTTNDDNRGVFSGQQSRWLGGSEQGEGRIVMGMEKMDVLNRTKVEEKRMTIRF